MDRFPRTSYVFPDPDCFLDTKFHPGLGVHVWSSVTEALACRLGCLTSDASMRQIFFPDECVSGRECRDKMRSALRYAVESNRSSSGRIHVEPVSTNHSVLNIERSTMYEIDQFMISTELFVSSDCYRGIVANAISGRRRTRFSRVPFQQFMSLDMLLNMIDRSGLKEHRSWMFRHLKDLLGFHWLTVSKCEIIHRLMNRRVVAHSIRRRMGKSVQVTADLARALCFFPRAGIKAIYTVHNGQSAKDMHGIVFESVGKLVTMFNTMQFYRYQSRKHARGGQVDNADYYYQASYDGTTANLDVNVAFRMLNDNGESDGGVRVGMNTFRAVGYVRKTVSVF